jgi:hypothetical protein
MGWVTLSAYFVIVGIATGLYGAFDMEPTAGFHMAGRLASLFAISAWFADYARRHRIAQPMDMGLFLYLAGFVLVPYYVVRAEGWRRGLGTLLMLGILIASSMVIAWGIGMWGGASA